jgi:N-acetylglucosamine-6-sulfatase
VLKHRLPARRSLRLNPPLRLLLAGTLLLSAVVLQAPSQTASATMGGNDPKPADSAPVKPDKRPNVVLITTDDQTLADLRYMPRTRRLIAGQGVTFDGISPHPLCCPARAEILTGQFAQNNGVRSNKGQFGGYKRLRTRNTIATWLNRAGYQTMFMGKFLNGYSPWSDRGPAAGWDDWNPTVRGVYKYRKFTVRHNQRLRRYRGPYQTDFFTDLAVQKIRGASRMQRPFFLWQSYVAPHVSCPPRKETEACWSPPMAATRHRGLFTDAIPPSMRSDAFNEDVGDKPFPLSETPEIDDEKERKILLLHRRRLQSLQAVDEGVARMMDALRRTGELRNTLVIFTSDNGYLLGEHRYTGKVLPYEPALQVPLLMRGPGLPAGVVRKRVATLVDLAPTIVAVAHARAGLVMDGRNLLPIATRNKPSWETLLIQAGQYRTYGTGWFYRGVRTDRYSYAYYPYSDEDELYDRRKDPDQLTNVAGDPRYAAVVRLLKRQAKTLGSCAGWQCRRSFRQPPAPLPADTGYTPDPPSETPTETPDPSTGTPTVTAEPTDTATAAETETSEPTVFPAQPEATPSAPSE